MTDHRHIAASASPPIPPAPPPPPPKIKSRSYFERFVAQPLQSAANASRPSSVQAHRPDGGPLNPLVPKLLGVRTGHSLEATHKTGLDISALDINRERTHAVLAGKEILKTVRVQGNKIVDETNLRAAVLNYADSHPRQREGLGIQDVKWSHGQFGSCIATAVANGKVILYDLNRASVELVRLHEHTRQVHKLAFNPHQGYLLLSASHDATVRLWDLRDLRRDAAACTSRDQFSGISGGIRDVQWSPTDALDFAFGTDNGTIQRWDFRHNKGPKQKIPAHDQKTCTSIDWHPDGKHLLSAGVDRTVKVWDFSVDGRRQKAAYVLTTPYPVHRARWRPPYWSDEFHEKGSFQCTQVATSYDRDHPIVHVWDLRRPHLPYREINKFRSPPSDMLWQTRDALWTVGREGIFQQNDVHHAPKTTERRPLQAIAISPNGEMSGVAQKRTWPRRPTNLSYNDDMFLGAPPDKHGSFEKGSLRNSADGSLEDDFGAFSMKRHHGRTASNRSAKSYSSTPPSDVTPQVMFLPDSMNNQGDQFHPDQLAFRGTLPGAINVQIFAYLARKYRAQSLPDRPVLESYLELEQPFQRNAEYAQRAAYHRLAQTWTLIGAATANATKKRAELHRSMRMKDKKAKFEDPNNNHGQLYAHTKPFGVPQNPAVRAILGPLDKSRPASPFSKPATPIESTSQLATPLARPVNTSGSTPSESGRSELPDPDHGDKIHLPPSMMGVPREDKDSNLASAAQSNTNGSHWYDSAEGFEERRAAAGSWRASPRIPLSLNPAPARNNNPNVPPPLERHDSGESFTMFSASTDSQYGSSVSGSFESVGSALRGIEGSSTSWQHAPDKSSFGRSTDPAIVDQDAGLSPTTKLDLSTITAPSLSQARHIDKDISQDDTGHLMPPNSTERFTQEIDALKRTNQLMRHDSSESSAYASSYEGTSFLSTYSADMEASGTIIPEAFDEPRSPQASQLTSPVITKTISQSTVPTKDSQLLLLSDYEAVTVDAESTSAFTVVDLLNSILQFHTDTLSDAQFPSLLLLLLAPLLPQTHAPSSSSDIDVDEVLNAFTETFTALGLTRKQAEHILSSQLGELIATGINPYQAESILHTYHAQMHSLSLFNSAASLRRLAYPTMPAVYEQALKDTQLGLLCLSCKSPINNPKDKMRCESCKRAQAPCPVCWSKYPAFEPITAKHKSKAKHRDENGHKRKGSATIIHAAVSLDDHNSDSSPSTPEKWTPTPATLWTWCSLCGHGGHTNCLSTWFADAALSDGACATEGCLCDCVSGHRRQEKMQELLHKKVEKERSKAVKKGDDWKVRESRAVSAVRGTFGESGSQPPSPGRQHQQSQIPNGARKIDSKKVRALAPASGFGLGPRTGASST